MKYTININHELKLIEYRHSGIIFAEDIGEAWKEFLAIQEFTNLKYNLLSDYRNGKFQFKRKLLNDIVDYMKKIEMIVRGKKQAIIIDDPTSVAESILFGNDVYKAVGFNVRVFSTENSAIRWLVYDKE
jgi:hypothetical protein